MTGQLVVVPLYRVDLNARTVSRNQLLNAAHKRYHLEFTMFHLARLNGDFWVDETKVELYGLYIQHVAKRITGLRVLLFSRDREAGQT